MPFIDLRRLAKAVAGQTHSEPTLRMIGGLAPAFQRKLLGRLAHLRAWRAAVIKPFAKQERTEPAAELGRAGERPMREGSPGASTCEATPARATANPWNADVPFSYSSLWLGSEECLKWVQKKTSNNPELHWLRYAIATYFKPALSAAPSQRPKDDFRCLILGANEGWMERLLCESGFTGEIVASDIADRALARAEARARELGLKNVRYQVADLNRTHFTGPFDFIIAEGVLHHITEIGGCLESLAAALAPDGYLFASEFEGPFRFQLDEKQVRWINAALSVLPRVLRPLEKEGENLAPATPQENARTYFHAPDEKAVAAADPSEAICGPTLKQLIPQFFNIVERKGFGGTLLSYMTAHFDFARTNVDPFAREWLKVLMAIEDTLIQTGVLEDEFVFYVLKKKTAAVNEPGAPFPG